ncbi:MAG: CHASE2 domain-containing protein [Gammaproteobacteria bacterium]
MSKRIPIFLGLFLLAITLWISIAPTHFAYQLMERLDAIDYDLQLRAHVLTHGKPKDSAIAIIDIDDDSLNAEGRWPWPRSKVAKLVDELQQLGAQVIAFDMFFSEPESNIVTRVLDKLEENKINNSVVISTLQNSKVLFNDDSILAKSLSDNLTVLAVSFLPSTHTQNTLPAPLLQLTPQEQEQFSIIKAAGYISNIPVLMQAAKKGGFINAFADSDGIVRHAPLIMQYQNGVYPGLALQAVLSLLNQDIKIVSASYGRGQRIEGIKIGEITIPTDEKAQVLIPFIGGSYTFPYFSATAVLNHKVANGALFGKIVFVGTSATGLGDLQATSVQSPFPGVEIQASIAQGLLKNSFSSKPAWVYGANALLTLVLGLIAALLFPYLGPKVLSIIFISVPIISMLLNSWIWNATGLVLSIFMPVTTVSIIAFLNILYGYLFETRKREELKKIFGQYVPEEHIEQMLKNTKGFNLSGEDRDMSVMFADIRDFTSISENLTATELVDLLNTFFTPMTNIIFLHSGTIDKYVGDMIMAFWGAPLEDAQHASHALRSALDMQEKLKEMRQTEAMQKWPEIHMGIGINSGEMSVGDMGSQFHRNYTVLGDAVNMASRVEGLTKFYGVDILVTENTQKNQPGFVFRKVDRVRVKGKKSAIEIYEVLCERVYVTEEITAELSAYHQALDMYFQQNWDGAYMKMLNLSKVNPNKKLYSIYLKRIEECRTLELPADWNGVYVHTSK